MRSFFSSFLKIDARLIRGAWLAAMLVLMACRQIAFAQTEPRFSHLNREHGLSQSGVQGLMRDQAGFMWFGTGNGLDRFDGYQMRSYRAEPDCENCPSDPGISALLQAKDGSIWLGTDQGSLDVFSPITGLFEKVPPSPLINTMSGKPIHVIAEVAEGELWIGSEQGLFGIKTATQNVWSIPEIGPVNGLHLGRDGAVWLATDTGLYLTRANTEKPILGPKVAYDFGIVNDVLESDSGKIWVASERGLYCRDTAHSWLPVALTVPSLEEPCAILRLCEGKDGVFWLGTEQGLLRYCPELPIAEGGLFHYRNDPTNPSSLSQNFIRDVYEDPDGVVWVATWGGGVDRLNRHNERFFHYRQHANQPGSLANNMIISLVEDQKHQLWVGTEGGLDLYEPGNPGSFKHIPLDPSETAPDVVSGLVEGLEGDYWVATFNGLVHLSADFKTTKRFTLESHNLPDNRLWGIVATDVDQIWLGTRSKGLVRMDLHEPGAFIQYAYDPNNPSSIGHDSVCSLYIDRNGLLWAGTLGGGLQLFEASNENTFRRFVHDDKKQDSLSSNVVICLHQDSQERFWVGTLGGGLNQMLPGERFRRWTQRDGLPGNSVNAILSDNAGYLWLATDDGLARFHPDAGVVATYVVSDGLQGNEFNASAMVRSSEGRFYFGGINGLTAFYPEEVETQLSAPRAVLTNLYLNNLPVQPGNDVLAAPIEATSSLMLDYKDKVISLEFSALTYADPSRNRFAYRLDGFHDNWVETDASYRLATFTALRPGDYVFHVKAANKQGDWGPAHTLSLRVEPPFWKSWWTYSLYASLVLGLFLSMLHAQRKKLLYERDMVGRLREIDKLKDDFLANTSHELRTPLNGIIGLAESMLDGAAGNVNLRQAAQLTMIASSGRRLSALVDDILDFSKLKHHGLELQPQDVELHGLIEVVFAVCRPLADDKGIHLINLTPEGKAHAYADEGRLKQVLYNLVANAIKFTDQGEVRVSCELNGNMWAVSVSDTGVGIPEEKQPWIFESFEQVEDSRKRTRGGAGLGLALTRKLVELHGGEIHLVSKPDEGSTFTFTIPQSDTDPDLNATITPSPRKLEAPITPVTIPAKDHARPAPRNPQTRFHILIVDDDVVNRQVLLNHLSQIHLKLSAVRDGYEALDFLKDQKVDLILLDIMMPGMSGFEVCRKIRKTHPVEELPIIFLSARHQVDDILAGFEAGASDYLAKPFHKQELMERVKVHLRLVDARQSLVEAHSGLKQALADLQDKNEELLHAHQKLILQEKMATLGTLASGVVHELKNPANYTNLCAQSLEEEMVAFRTFLLELAGEEEPEMLEALRARMEPLFEQLHTVVSGTDRLKEIALNLAGFSRMGKGEQRYASLADCLGTTIALARARFKDTVNFHIDIADPMETLCRPAELGQVFLNIMVNACQAIATKLEETGTRGKGDLFIQAKRESKQAVITFKDNGGGMPPEVCQRIFEPFFTTKPEGEGVGLGLSISKQIIEEHGGILELESELGRGSTFRIELTLISEPDLFATDSNASELT